jgi:hypothetical protein
VFGLASFQYLCIRLKHTRCMIQLSGSRFDQHCTVGNSEYLEDIEGSDEKWCGGGVRHLELKLVIGIRRESEGWSLLMLPKAILAIR